jgi:multidrug efflux pump subunit AcrB
VTHKAPTVGLAGRIAHAFLHSRLTPLTIIASVMLGLLALATLPREEEPQIKVPMVDVQLAWPGAPVEQVERQLTTPVERQLWEIPGLEYLYSTSRADGALLIARFEVGMNPDQALTRVRSRLDQAMPLLPAGATIASVAPRSIDDVPVLALTLTAPRRRDLDQGELRRIASELATELRKTAGVSRVQVLGGERRAIRIEPDPGRMSETGVSLDRLLGTLSGAGLSFPAGSALQSGAVAELRADSPFSSGDEISALEIPTAGGRTVRLSEIARVIDAPGEPTRYVFRAGKDGAFEPAVTVEVAKRPGVNATTLVSALSRRVTELRPILLTRDVEVHVTRDYGATAKHKSDDLMFHLLLATLSVIALIAFALGRREAAVVAVAIPVTLSLTLFLYRFLGYTLNRVTLFALIFSIGILVDDAIVVVENIARHFRNGDGRDPDRRVVEAVDEVGNPTVLATIAVIAAILPLGFVRGMTGPYMRPIPIGASLAMLFSLGVAFAISPWAARRVLRAGGRHAAAAAGPAREPWYDRTYRRMMARLLSDARARRGFFAAIVLLLAGAVSLVALQVVTVKLLPFDNKSEFEVVLDMPPGAPLERTLAVAQRLSRALTRVPEVEQQVAYVGLGSPNTFNGLVRHYDFRTEPRFASIQVTLLEGSKRKRQSHAIAASVRPEMERIAAAAGARVKVVEVPPGPPVIATLVAEVYGPSLDGQRAFARSVWGVFQRTKGVVDTDLMLTENAPRVNFTVDRDRAALAGVSPGAAADAAAGLYGGRTVGVLRAPRESEPVAIDVRLSPADRADLSALAALRLGPGAGTPLAEMVRVTRDVAPPEIHHKNLRRVVYVLGNVAGHAESPVYAIGNLRPAIQKLATPDGVALHQLSTTLPASDEHYGLKWDGEWHMTYEVFRDMGLAFGVVLVLIYLLTVGWFKSLTTPLVIMLPIPLSLVGILPAHALLGAFFTATSMIGFIAGAGITVRNSIILVDFIELRRAQGLSLREAVVDAGAVRFRPMVLTAAAVTVGGAVILFDPIFQGLAVALIGGEVAATVLSRVAVPVLYYLVRRGDDRAVNAGDATGPRAGALKSPQPAINGDARRPVPALVEAG